MADLNQKKINPEIERLVKKQLFIRRNKEQKHAQLIKQTGRAIAGAGSLAKNLGQRLGSDKLKQFGTKAEENGREAQAIGQEATTSKYIGETVNQRNAARNVNDETLPAGAPLSSIASPLDISEDERAQELLNKKKQAPSREGQSAQPTAQEAEQPDQSGPWGQQAQKIANAKNYDKDKAVQPTGQRIKPSWQDQEAFDIDNQEIKRDQARRESEREEQRTKRREKRETERERRTDLTTAQRASGKNNDETSEETVQPPKAAGEPEEKGEATATALAAQLGSAEILKFCWLNGWYIVPLLYVNLHGIIKYTCNPTWLCEFGEEWTMEKKAQAQAAALATGEKGEANPVEQITNTSLKWAEIIGIIVIDILIIMTIVLLFYAIFSNIPWYIKFMLKLKGIT